MPCEALYLEGSVRSGLGEGAGFMALDWVARQFRSKLGFSPYPGTLNLSLSGGEWEYARAAMQSARGILIEPPPGFCPAKCFTLVIDGKIGGAAVIPDVPDYPADKLELVSPVAVRNTLGLSDGDRVTLHLLAI